MADRKGKFVRVKCSKCKASQTIFGKASTKVRCLECSTVLAIPSGGNAKIRSRVEEVL
ncbi:30S ribosomal protein S27e [archaeon]|jgi:small subunit ribosomal protein S27e|nr:30S ribosomal protein S27e [archaeon]MBT3577598.1 30S ribosomal protein S27e [archaeon]MBT6820146.1 30S ribosomal protein S27e [archaeon]MBT6956565.1 30S ribosomal protein S27e [archaeon]MBT7025696.1 30S ribosomal protein S27e [archaeon]